MVIRIPFQPGQRVQPLNYPSVQGCRLFGEALWTSVEVAEGSSTTGQEMLTLQARCSLACGAAL